MRFLKKHNLANPFIDFSSKKLFKIRLIKIFV